MARTEKVMSVVISIMITLVAYNSVAHGTDKDELVITH
jgi:hypothetical protein